MVGGSKPKERPIYPKKNGEGRDPVGMSTEKEKETCEVDERWGIRKDEYSSKKKGKQGSKFEKKLGHPPGEGKGEGDRKKEKKGGGKDKPLLREFLVNSNALPRKGKKQGKKKLKKSPPLGQRFEPTGKEIPKKPPWKARKQPWRWGQLSPGRENNTNPSVAKEPPKKMNVKTGVRQGANLDGKSFRERKKKKNSKGELITGEGYRNRRGGKKLKKVSPTVEGHARKRQGRYCF